MNHESSDTRRSMIAFCGLDCGKCGAYIATRDNDDERRKETAREWSEIYKARIDPKTIHCMGCRSQGPFFTYCSQCRVRRCGQDAGVENCAMCADFSCEKVEEILKYAPEARENLERLRA